MLAAPLLLLLKMTSRLETQLAVGSKLSLTVWMHLEIGKAAGLEFHLMVFPLVSLTFAFVVTKALIPVLQVAVVWGIVGVMTSPCCFLLS